MDKEFEISMYVTVPSHETESSITDKFIEWIESNGYTCVGIIRDSEYNEDEEEDGWEYSEN